MLFEKWRFEISKSKIGAKNSQISIKKKNRLSISLLQKCEKDKP